MPGTWDRNWLGIQAWAPLPKAGGEGRELATGTPRPDGGRSRGGRSRLPNTDRGGGDRRMEHRAPGIGQPESPPVLAAPERSLWPWATGRRARQDAQRRRTTRHRKPKPNRNPAREGAAQAAAGPRWPVRGRRGRSQAGPRSPGGSSRQTAVGPETPTHWPLVSFFFFGFFLFNTQTFDFSKA